MREGKLQKFKRIFATRDPAFLCTGKTITASHTNNTQSFNLDDHPFKPLIRQRYPRPDRFVFRIGVLQTNGNVVAGVDFKTLPSSVSMPTGAAKANIKPLPGLAGAGTLKLKLLLLPSADDGYEVGTSPVNIKLVGE